MYFATPFSAILFHSTNNSLCPQCAKTNNGRPSWLYPCHEQVLKSPWNTTFLPMIPTKPICSTPPHSWFFCIVDVCCYYSFSSFATSNPEWWFGMTRLWNFQWLRASSPHVTAQRWQDSKWSMKAHGYQNSRESLFTPGCFSLHSHFPTLLLTLYSSSFKPYNIGFISIKSGFVRS